MADMWDDSSSGAALLTRRVGRKRGPMLRRRQSVPDTSPETREEKTVTAADMLQVRKALDLRPEISSTRKGKSLLLSFCLIMTASCFLVGSLLFAFHSQQLFISAPERLPLSLSLQRDLSDTQVHGFLALLSQWPDIGHVRFVTKEQTAFALQERYPEHIPFLETLGSQDSGESIELTLRSSADPESLLSLFTKPAVSPLLASSAFSEIGEWEHALQGERASKRMTTFFALAVSVFSLFLLVLTFRLVLRLEQERRREEWEIATQLGSSAAALRSSFVFPVAGRFAPALLFAALLCFSVFFLLE